MISINFSCIIHFIIILFTGFFIQSFFAMLYDNMLFFKQKKNEYIKKYEEEGQATDVLLLQTTENISNLNNKLALEINKVFSNKYDQSIYYNIQEKFFFTYKISQLEQEGIYMTCEKMVQVFKK